MKTFISELEQHKAMMERLADCSDMIEAAGELLIKTLKQGGKYSRRIEAIASEKDCLVAISTSGKSKNILNAVEAARLKGMAVIGLTGCDGGELSGQVTHSVVVPSNVTARIQEAHILIGHWWCGAIEGVN